MQPFISLEFAPVEKVNAVLIKKTSKKFETRFDKVEIQCYIKQPTNHQ
jgi:hypothetical protein